MNTDQAKTLSESALTRLMGALDQGKSEVLKLYLAVMSRFHKYSWGNILLIYTQCPEATHVAGFHSWLKLQRHVRKGEKGIVILAPMVGRKKSDASELPEDERTQLFGFRTAHVFDVSQTEGAALPEFARVTGDPQNATDRLKSFVASKQITLEYDERIRPAHGMSSGGKITLLPHLSAAEEFSVLAHEIAHELLHRGERRKGMKTVKETEAEAVAFVVSTAIGLEPGTASSDYIQLYSGDKDTLAESLSFVQRTAAEILKAILPDDPAANLSIQ